GVAEGGGEVGLSHADSAEEDRVAVVLQEVEPEEVFYLHGVYGFGPVEVELVEGFNEREAGGLDGALDGAVVTLTDFTFDEALEVVEVRPLLLAGLLCVRLGLFADVRKF